MGSFGQLNFWTEICISAVQGQSVESLIPLEFGAGGINLKYITLLRPIETAQKKICADGLEEF
ncbi:hypothetical protein BJD99_04355 [Rhodococcus sp. 1163]|nr:hypothetical protein BJD99_04355 [Rhodococcus sp. 1163]